MASKLWVHEPDTFYGGRLEKSVSLPPEMHPQQLTSPGEHVITRARGESHLWICNDKTTAGLDSATAAAALLDILALGLDLRNSKSLSAKLKS